MASTNILVHVNMNGNEIQNVLAQKLATAPSNPQKGQFYFNTTDNCLYVYNGSSWVNAMAQGTTYTNGNGILINGNTISTDTTVASKTDIGDGKIIYQKNGTSFATASVNQTSTITVNYTIPTQASDIGALPVTTTIGDGKIIYQKNGTAFATATANQTSTVTVNYTIPTAVTDLSDAGNYALKSDVASAIIPKGSIAAISGLPTLEIDHRGWMYNFTAAFTTTSDFVEGSGKKYPAGTNVVVVEYSTDTYKYDIFSGFVDTETYDAHLANTTIHVTSTDKIIWNGKQDAISDLDTIRANATAGAGAATTIAGYGDVVTHNASEFATSSQGGKADTAAQVYSASNPALTTSSGVCSWTVTHNIGSRNVEVKVYEISSWEEVMVGVTNTSTTTATVKINSSSNISAATYQVIVVGK